MLREPALLTSEAMDGEAKSASSVRRRGMGDPEPTRHKGTQVENLCYGDHEGTQVEDLVLRGSREHAGWQPALRERYFRLRACRFSRAAVAAPLADALPTGANDASTTRPPPAAAGSVFGIQSRSAMPQRLEAMK